MKLLTLKLLTITTLLSTSLFATQKIDEAILKFEQAKISSLLQRQQITLDAISIALKKDLKQDNWYGYVFNLTFTVKGKQVTQKDTLFTNGVLMTPDLVDIKTQRSFKGILYPTLGKKFYDKEHLIAGNEKGKNKIVVFSDPLCPFCIAAIPDIIKHVKKYPQNTALYYYHFPLQMHPAAEPLSKIMEVAKNKGVKDAALKIYEGNFDKYFDANETDINKILEAANKVLETTISLQEIEKISVQEDLKMGENAMVQGTPTVYVNGNIDKSISEYKNLK